MALSDKQKHRTIFYLGWSGLTLVEDSTQFNSVVRDRLGTVAKPLNSYIESLVKDLLDCLERVDLQLKDAQCRLSAAKVDSITLNEKEIHYLKKERNRYIRELSDHLDIPITKSNGSQVAVVV